MTEETTARFDRLVALTPRRFHITSNPPFGVGLVLCGHVNTEEEDGSQFLFQRGGIRNCKPGIWTSIRTPVPGDEEGMMECILRWVAPGTIDLSQDMEKWEEYEKATRQGDEDAFKGIEEMARDGAEWEGHGKYLTREAYEKLADGENDLGWYLETLTLSIFDGPQEHAWFCIGGMGFGQDAVGGPPRVSVLKKGGQVVAVRIHGGEDEEDEEKEDED